ncbi:MAG: hypothetical protein RL531_1860 [Actinomycetota bacterium]|jgi:hypothetical protein
MRNENGNGPDMEVAVGCERERGSIPEWVMLLVMGIGVVLALWAIVQPSLGQIVTDALSRLR